jgi:hypothetical protein
MVTRLPGASGALTSMVPVWVNSEDDALVYAQALESATRLRMAAPTWVESMQVSPAGH